MLSSEQQVHALKHEIYQREKYIESQQAENSALRGALYKQQRICGWLKTNVNNCSNLLRIQADICTETTPMECQDDAQASPE